MRSPTTMMRAVLIFLTGVLLTGCVSVLPEPAPPAARYVIAPAEFAEAHDGARVDFSLAVEDPQATRVYDTTRIALTRAPRRIEYYAAGEWADRGPRLVQTALVRSFENSGRILSVGDRASLSVSDFVLQTDIRAFHAVYADGTPSATVEIFARLMSPRGRVYASRLFRRQAAADRDAVPAVAEAFNAAMSVMLEDIVAWSFAEAEAVQAK